MKLDDDFKSKILMGLARSGSENLLQFLDKHGVQLDGLLEVELGRKIVQTRYGINDKDFIAVDFVFWIAYFVEREAKDLIIFPEVYVGIRTEVIDFLVTLFDEENILKLKPFFDSAKNHRLDIQKRAEALNEIIDNLHFGGKIKVIEKLYASKKDPFVKLMRKIQDLRNHVAHGRLDMLKYDSFELSTGKGQVKLITDLMNESSKNDV